MTANAQPGLTNMQLELLKIFQYSLPESQLLEIRDLLARYFAEKASDEMDNLWDERGWSNETMKSWLSENLHSKGNA